MLHSMLSGVSRGSLLSDLPPAWIGPARPQLDSEELARRTKLTFSLPRAELEAAMQKEKSVMLNSPQSQYSSGAEFRLAVTVAEVGVGKLRKVAATVLLERELFQLPSYSQVACSVAVYQLRSESSIRRVPLGTLGTGKEVLFSDSSSVYPMFSASSPSDLEPHLVDGCLRLEASVAVLH